MNLDEKKKIVEDLHERFLRSKIVILGDYKGLDVAAVNDLRRRLKEVGAEYKVVKNSLLVRASHDTDIAQIQEHFKGPSAVALSYEDPVAPARVLTKFADDHDNLEIQIGVMDGKVIDLGAIKALSNLPSHEVLLGQFLSTLNAVPTGLVRALSDIPRRLLNVLTALKEQKEANTN